MAKKNGRRRSPEEAARREKIRELLALSGIEGMEDIQQLFRETIACGALDGHPVSCYPATKVGGSAAGRKMILPYSTLLWRLHKIRGRTFLPCSGLGQEEWIGQKTEDSMLPGCSAA